MASDSFKFLDRTFPPATPCSAVLSWVGGLGVGQRLVAARFGFPPTLPLSRLPRLRRSRLETYLRSRWWRRALHRYQLERIGDKRRSGSYAGGRHLLRLPVRGQRTHSNARTVRRALLSL